MWRVIGRQQERERLAAAVDAASSGRSAVLVVVGEPGIGKTVLLADAGSYAAAAGLRVREARGVQAERDVPYAGLHALLSPLVTDGVLAGLPRVHAEALEVALGLRAGPGPTRLTVSGRHCSGSSVPSSRCACWSTTCSGWTPASVDALTFAARRLDAEPVVLLCHRSAVAQGVSFPPVGGLPVLRLAGARRRDRTRLLLAPTVAERLRIATGGNPLAMVEHRLGAQRRAGVRRPAALPREAAGQRPGGDVRRAARDPGGPARGRRRGCSPWPVRRRRPVPGTPPPSTSRWRWTTSAVSAP